MNTDNKVLYFIVVLAVLIGIASTFLRPSTTTTTTTVIVVTVTPPAQTPGQSGQAVAGALSSVSAALPSFSDFLKTSTGASVAQAVDLQQQVEHLPFKDRTSYYVGTGGVYTRCSGITSDLQYEGAPAEVQLWNTFGADIKLWYFNNCQTSQ